MSKLRMQSEFRPRRHPTNICAAGHSDELTGAIHVNFGATYRRLSPEQQQFLCGSHLGVIDLYRWLTASHCRIRMCDASLEQDEGDGRDAASCRFESAVAPIVVARKTTTNAFSRRD